MFVRSMQRGQALVETAIFLPIVLLALFGIIWASQTGVVNERLQLAVRYSGVLASAINPYTQFSLNTVYATTEGVVPVLGCATPPAAAITNSSPFPAPSSQPFWNATGTPIATCVAGQRTLSGGGFSRASLLVSSQANISATTAVPNMLQGTLGTLTTLHATQNFFKNPDVGTVVKCYPELAVAMQQTFTQTDPGGGDSAPLPVTLSNAELTLGPGCQ